MLSREKRLVKNRDFERVYQKGKRVSSDSFNLTFLPNRTAMARVGIVVGKKFSKKAVERNKAKRIFREALKGAYNDLRPGTDMVIFVKNINNQVPKLEVVKAELKKAFGKAGITK